ncbi:putative alanyl-tRNA synthetase [Catenaria anguillulae PL171]|uniref:Alanine--tRNA ligase n=1 Tax=Catenaria anguillulae PL171 TaxID=765915 RepID=A0A1Y2HFC5_9FUNG|nr:putative alanyl-tRNA synthetase [Catenaria anguillulae PL171]
MTTNTQQQQWTAAKVRSTFIDYFKSLPGGNDHIHVPSSKTIPHDDPTLLFANAGMNQFKPIFLGTADPNSPMAKWQRAANSQKCIRAGGKHNDLDDVGKDTYHHTFFEMLGNWSFGNYFKKEAIQWAWTLLTQVYGLDKNRLYVTYFGGDEKQGLEPDTEARDLWIQMGLPKDRVLPYGCKENFWEMGDQGPCGPCSEIHYDLLDTGRFVPALVNADDPTLIEIWNLVFIQFNREADGSLRQLPAKHVDTGMGFERLVCALQGQLSNYDTDVFSPIFARIQEVTGARPYAGKLGKDDADGVDMAYRVVADHIRTLTVSISDGGVPSNDGRGYVLRRILRRGVRYARSGFNVNIGTFFSSLVDVVAASLGDAFPEVRAHVETVKQILDEEEAAFAKTLDRGIKLFESIVAKGGDAAKTISGADAWKLYDTFGFPIDLTRLMAEEKGLQVDDAGFEAEQAKAKELSRRRKDAQGEQVIKLDVHAIKAAEAAGVAKTDDSFKYNTATLEGANVIAVYKNGEWILDNKQVGVSEGEAAGILLDRTNFYAESGGQEYDTGSLAVDGELEFAVENVQVYAGYVLHTGLLKYGTLSVGQSVTAAFDALRRWPLRNNHTATHVLNHALRATLGDGVDQKGSLVAPTKLRFDFSAKAPLAHKDLVKIEAEAADTIKRALPVYAKEVPLAQAKAINGLRAVFGEVYPDPVRVVSIGVAVEDLVSDPNNAKWPEYSIELCGGTHAGTSLELGSFAVMEESAIAKGVRRIVAVTGPEAIAAHDEAASFVQELNKLSGLSGFALGEAVKEAAKEVDLRVMPAAAKMQAREVVGAHKKRFDEWDKAQKAAKATAAVEEVKAYFAGDEAKNKPYLVRVLDVGGNNKAVQSAIAAVKATGGEGKAALFITVAEGAKVSYAAYVDKSLHGKVTATQWAEVVAKAVDGKMGGKEEMAQGAGSKVEAVDEAVRLAEEFAKVKLA